MLIKTNWIIPSEGWLLEATTGSTASTASLSLKHFLTIFWVFSNVFSNTQEVCVFGVFFSTFSDYGDVNQAPSANIPNVYHVSLKRAARYVSSGFFLILSSQNPQRPHVPVMFSIWSPPSSASSYDPPFFRFSGPPPCDPYPHQHSHMLKSFLSQNKTRQIFPSCALPPLHPIPFLQELNFWRGLSAYTMSYFPIFSFLLLFLLYYNLVSASRVPQKLLSLKSQWLSWWLNLADIFKPSCNTGLWRCAFLPDF